MPEIEIKSGQTLSGIARERGTTIEELQRLNPNITDPNLIYAGAPLIVPDIKEVVREVGFLTDKKAEDELRKIKEITEEKPAIAQDVDVASPIGERLRISTDNLAEYLGRGYKVVPTETTEVKVDEFGRPISDVPAEVLEEGEETAEQKEVKNLESDIIDIDAQITFSSKDIAKVQSSIKDDSTYEETGEIRNIRLGYDRRREMVRDVGERQKKALQTTAIRWGTARYSPLLALNLIDTHELELTKIVNDLKRDEDEAVNKMKKAIRKEDYDLLLDAKDELEKKREKKNETLKKLSETIKKKNDEIEKSQEKAKKSIVINDLNGQGKTAGEIYDTINFDEKGNMITNPMTISEITNAIEETKITDEVRIENINQFFERKIEEITAQDYLQAQKDWLASGGTITDFKGAFPPDSLLDEKELKKLPKSIWTPTKPEELTEVEKLKSARQTMNSKLDSVKGGDGYISPQDWNESKRSWIAEGLNANDFINQFYIYINPSHPEDYGQREANYIRGIGGGETSNPFE